MYKERKTQLLVESEKGLGLILDGVLSKPLYICFHIAIPCGESFGVKQHVCRIPKHVVRKAMETKLEAAVHWCHGQFRAGNNFTLKINMEIALKSWYAKQYKRCPANMIDAKGAIIKLTNVSNSRKVAKQDSGCFETGKLMMKMLTLKRSLKTRTLNVY